MKLELVKLAEAVPAHHHVPDQELSQAMLEHMQAVQGAKQKHEEVQKLPHFGFGPYALGALGGGALLGGAGALLERKLGGSIEPMLSIPGAFTGVIGGQIGIGLLDEHKHPEYFGANRASRFEQNESESRAHEMAKLNPQLWDRTRLLNKMKEVPKYDFLHEYYGEPVPKALQPSDAERAAQHAANMVVLAHAMNTLRKTYTPETKAKVEEQQTQQRQREQEMPKTNVRQGTFTKNA